MRNPKSGDDGKEENDGMLVLRRSPLNIQQYRPCKCNNRRMYTKHQLFYSSYYHEIGLFYWFPAYIWVAGRFKMAFGDMHLYAINICMLNRFRKIYLDAIDLNTETDFICFIAHSYSLLSMQVFHCATCQQDLYFPSFASSVGESPTTFRERRSSSPQR